ncbi:MAG TPA: hypothetical protein VLL82_03685, partial [Mycobacterium sp.]|nr:hypothetical protein [Mycobacterium sp.]
LADRLPTGGHVADPRGPLTVSPPGGDRRRPPTAAVVYVRRTALGYAFSVALGMIQGSGV